MADAADILVLGHRGLLGQALREACQGRCQIIEGGREVFDLAQAAPAGLGGPPPLGQTPGPDLAGARQSLRQVREGLPGLGAAAHRLHDRLDLLRRAVLERRPRLVINCIGYTNVDRAESEPELAMAVNAHGAQAVARACLEAGAHLIHISTDYVFDGRASRPYREDDPPAPLSVYGRSKLAGERLVQQALPGALVVRTAWLFGPGRGNFVDKVLAKARQGGPVKVVSQEVGSPTYAPDLAPALLELGLRWVGGVLHVVNEGQASRLELARQSLALAGLDPGLVEPIGSAELGLPAARPAYSVLDAGRAASVRGRRLPTWQEALARYLARTQEDK